MKHIITFLLVLISFGALAQQDYNLRMGLDIKQAECTTNTQSIGDTPSIVSLYIQPDFNFNYTDSLYLTNIDLDFAIEVSGMDAGSLLSLIDINSISISSIFDRADTLFPSPWDLNPDTTINYSHLDTITIDTARNIITIEVKLYALNKYQPLQLDSGQIARVVSFEVSKPNHSIGLTVDSVLWSASDANIHLGDLVASNHNGRFISGKEEQTLIGCPKTSSNFIHKSLKNSASVYPNPTNGPLTINVERVIHTIQIHNSIGQLVWTSDVNGQTQLSLDFSGQSSGPLFLRAFDESMNLVDTQKIIIVK